MNATSRPNLGGLFNGSTPPERSSSIAAALGSPAAGGDSDAPSSGSARAQRSTRAERGTRAQRSTGAGNAGPPPPTGGPVLPIGSIPVGSTGDASGPWAAVQWLDPVRVLGFYFDVLQTMFDVQRRVTMGVATVVSAPVRRAGVWR